MTLRIPALEPDVDIITAALAYARAGWYIIPVAYDTKAPTVLGKDWPSKSSRDPEQIIAWFTGTSHGLGLHVGRSGGVVLDVDTYDEFPEDLRPSLEGCPFQSTRDNDPRRGHYVFEAPEGRIIGNSRGDLGTTFGEVRGLNGIIVVQPTTHTKEHGRYEWLRHGEVPTLPKDIDAALPEGQTADAAVSDAVVRTFMTDNAAAENPALLKAILRSFAEECEEVTPGRRSSRHEALVKHAVWAMREARVGLFPAKAAVDALWTDFEALMQGETDRHPASEFKGVMAWAVAQALATDVEQRREEVQARLAERDARQAASVATTAPSAVTGHRDGGPDWRPPRQPHAYFGSDGIDVDLLGQDVLRMGPLRWGPDGAFWSYADGVWSPDKGAVERRVGRLIKGRFRQSHATNVGAYLRHADDVGEIDCGPITEYMNFTNGMLPWRTSDDLEPHAAHFGSTVQFPIAWEPSATCPKFDAFLAQVLKPDFIPLIWEVLGYMLMSGNPLQKAILFWGSGSNGKGTLMRVIEGMLGARNCSAVDLDALSDNRFASSSLFGRIANLAGDIDATYQESTGKFKKLTGGDLIDAEVKHQTSFRFTCWAVPLFSANKIPGSADTSHGYLRRWVPIHFHRQFSDADQDIWLDAKLAAELPGIAAKAVVALRALMERGHFEIEGEAKVAQAEFAEAVDQVRQWIVERTIEAPGHRENPRVLYNDYKSWAHDSGNGQLRIGEFYTRLENAGFPKQKSSSFYVEGLRVADPALRKAMETAVAEGTTLSDVEPPVD